ncbi:MAG: ABC transporter permease, partial [Haloarculaceae archaeon]
MTGDDARADGAGTVEGFDPDRETFQSVDWEATDGGLLAAVSRRDRFALATLLALVAAFLYDYLALPADRPTVTWPVTWNVTQLDWLFVGTLLALVFYAAWPLAANPRLTRYYWRQFRRNRLAVASLVYLGVVFLLGTVGPIFLEKPDLAITRGFQPPAFLSVAESVPVSCVGEVSNGACHGTLRHPLGTTNDGKDILVLIIYGMQVSMKVGLISTLLV